MAPPITKSYLQKDKVLRIFEFDSTFKGWAFMIFTTTYRQKKSLSIDLFRGACFILPLLVLFLPWAAGADLNLLKTIIMSHNGDLLAQSLSEGTYRGEAGILRINAEVGKALGLKVMMDPDYLKARALFEETDRLFKQAEEILENKEKGLQKRERVKKLGRVALRHNKNFKTARALFMDCGKKLNPERDERLDQARCSVILEHLLLENFVKASHNLRDTLGYFYNECQAISDADGPLNEDNIRFVNHVFREFTARASKDGLKGLDLDRQQEHARGNPENHWKQALKGRESRLIPHVALFVTQKKKASYPVDILLFMALMKQESRFNARAVSPVGAVGLTQIMPKTGVDLGMKNIYRPPYFKKGRTYLIKEREWKKKAEALILQIDEKNKTALAQQALDAMEKSLHFKQKRIKLYRQYKKEVLQKGTDDRLNPAKAVAYGYRYFARMMRAQKGDISLSLASYNAGAKRVKQYQGIPPYPETLKFRNNVTKYYRAYLQKLEISGKK